jgi:hypothetical protein
LLVSDQYLSQVITDTSATTYKFEFANEPALESNTLYWIVFTTSDVHDWKIGLKQIVTSSIDVDASFAYTVQANVSQDQVQNVGWSVLEAPTLILNLTISGCEVDLAPYPTSTPTPTAVVTQMPASSRTPKASASATPVVVLTPITANVTSSFDSTQTSLNLTAPATSTLPCTPTTIVVTAQHSPTPDVCV